VRDHPRVAVRSANAVGKSFLAACLTLWFLETHCPGYVVTTSSSWRGVEKVLWPEIRRIHRQAPCKLGGQLLKTEWQRGDQWAAFGVSADVPENFAGFRNANGILVIVDEASSLDREIHHAILGLAASAHSRVLYIGNPLRPQGPFYDLFASPAWECLSISALECPNVAVDRDIIPGLATSTWVEERRQEWGEESPAFKSRVLGEFPDSAEDSIIPRAWVEAAMKRDIPEIDKAALQLGCDVARYGSDRTVLCIRDKHAVRHVEWHLKKSTMDTAGRVKAVARDWAIRAENVAIDDTGVGGGVTDRLRELGMRVHGVNFAARAADPSRFANMRTEMYWNLRQALNPELEQARSGAGALAIPRSNADLCAEISLPAYGYASAGQIKLESKDDIKRRLGRSPDLADALALTFARREAEPRVILL